jgi:signal transduction histidine kinase/CheY-like chemotaxis protein
MPLALSATALLSLALPPFLPQERRAAEVAAAFAAEARGSTRWFQLGFELVEAQLDVDVSLALGTSELLLSVDPAAEAPGTRAAARAFAALCAAARDGTVAAAERIAESETPPPPEADPLLHAHFHLARARLYCFAGEDAREFDAAIAGRKAALEARDPVLAARAALVFHHVSPDGGTDNQRATLDEAAARVDVPEAGFLRPWLLAHEFVFHADCGREEEARRVRDELEALASAEGHRRALCFARMRRGARLAEGGADAEAIASYRAAREVAESLGDRREIAHLIEYEADSEIERGDLERASALVAENLACIEGRGLPECERGILQTQFELAVQRRDGELAAELGRRLDRDSREAESEWRRYAEVRERLARSEAERRSAEARLLAERTRIEERARLAWRLGAGAAVLALAALAGTALLGRRKLVAANARLRSEVSRANEAQEARARLERRLGQLERTESLGMMASGIAHDFNNLLACVLGSAELLAAHEGTEERRALVQAITAAGEQAARLCRQLQAYVGDAPVDPRPIDLAVLVRDVLPVLRAAAGGAEVRAEDAEEGASVSVVADRGQLEQVLLNLVVNARDAGARLVRVRTARRRLAEAEAEREGILGELGGGDHGVLEVADDGAGMSAEVLGRIFDPFFTTRFPGRGLGLAVAYGVVRRHGGGIQVESTPGAGARFRVYLQEAAAAAELVPARASHGCAPEPGAPIVVLDDEAGMRGLLARMLASAGHATIATGTGAGALEALARLGESPPPVLLLDLTMPGMDGPDVLHRVRAEHPSVAIVLMSGQGSRLLAEFERELRPDGVLPKPFDRSTLLDVIARAQAARSEPQVA